jgi:hypothetical protein
MRRKQPKRCSKLYTKSAACFSTSKLDVKNKEDILYSRIISHKNVIKVEMSAVSGGRCRVSANR